MSMPPDLTARGENHCVLFDILLAPSEGTVVRSPCLSENASRVNYCVTYPGRNTEYKDISYTLTNPGGTTSTQHLVCSDSLFIVKVDDESSYMPVNQISAEQNERTMNQIREIWSSFASVDDRSTPLSEHHGFLVTVRPKKDKDGEIYHSINFARWYHSNVLRD